MGRSAVPKGTTVLLAPSKTSTKEGLSEWKAQASSVVVLPLEQ
jgi:hypothetical protein